MEGHDVARVRILCRRHGLVCPQVVDYMNYIRPVDDGFDHPVAGSGAMLALWQRAYAASGATPPECWAEGLFRPDGHTVSVSDIKKAYKRLALRSHPDKRAQRGESNAPNVDVAAEFRDAKDAYEFFQKKLNF